MKLKRGDTVLIISGKDRGKTGKIEAILPTLNRVVVSGANAYKKHMKPSPAHPQGGIVEMHRSMDASNVMVIDAETKKPTRIGYKVEGTDKIRVARSTNKPLAA